jgi:lipid-binding SYLF domain-containing protein
MARYRHLPVWKAALDLAVHLEHAVRRFPRYHKYTLGSELRQTAQRLCRLVARANDARDAARLAALDELVHGVEEMKTLLTLAQEVKAFANFNEFAGAAELTVSLGKQSGGWRRRVRPEVPSPVLS